MELPWTRLWRAVRRETSFYTDRRYQIIITSIVEYIRVNIITIVIYYLHFLQPFQLLLRWSFLKNSLRKLKI